MHPSLYPITSQNTFRPPLPTHTTPLPPPHTHIHTHPLDTLTHTPTQQTKSLKDVENASQWCARYLTFSSFVNKPGMKTLEETALSVFSELPTNGLLADLLAYCFPASLSGDNTGVEAKMKRLLSRLRSVQDGEGSMPQALSVRYQTNSQVTSSHLQKTFGEDLGKFGELVQPGAVAQDSSYLLHTSAFEVGSFLYEFDSGYLEFLDTLFSVIVPEKTDVPLSFPASTSGDSSLLTISQLQQPSVYKDGAHSSVPYLSEFLSKLKKKAKMRGAPWQCVLPLLNSLHTWSQTACPQVNPGLHKLKKRKSGFKKTKTDEMKRDMTTLKVNLPPELIISCLKQREQVESTALKDPRSRSPLKAMTRSPPSNTRKEQSRSLHIEDSDSNVGSKELTEENISFQLPNSFGGSVGTTSTVQTPPLMQIPDGVLKVSGLVYLYL